MRNGRTPHKSSNWWFFLDAGIPKPVHSTTFPTYRTRRLGSVFEQGAPQTSGILVPFACHEKRNPRIEHKCPPFSTIQLVVSNACVHSQLVPFRFRGDRMTSFSPPTGFESLKTYSQLIPSRFRIQLVVSFIRESLGSFPTPSLHMVVVGNHFFCLFLTFLLMVV